MSDHHSIGVNAEWWQVGHSIDTWNWLRQAMNDIGISLIGHSTFSRSMVNSKRYHYHFGVVGDAKETKQKIADLWQNECPGGGLEIDIIY